MTFLVADLKFDIPALFSMVREYTNTINKSIQSIGASNLSVMCLISYTG